MADIADDLSVVNFSGLVGSSTHQVPAVAEIIEAAKRMRLQVEESQGRLELFVLTLERCGLCGHKARYIRVPRERIQFCRCRVAELKRELESVPGPLPSCLPGHISPFPQFMGIEIETIG